MSDETDVPEQVDASAPGGADAPSDRSAPPDAGPDDEASLRSGFVTFVGRPNVGKSSLVNAICGRKISIVSDKPQTTRHRIMGVLTRPGSQLVFVDTPGLHKPVTALGERVNSTALDAVGDVDVTCLVLDATHAFGKGDRWVADRLRLGELGGDRQQDRHRPTPAGAQDARCRQ